MNENNSPEIPDVSQCKVEPPVGYKFSNDVFISKTWLDDHNISYEDSALEETPYGLCARLRENDQNKNAT